MENIVRNHQLGRRRRNTPWCLTPSRSFFLVKLSSWYNLALDAAFNIRLHIYKIPRQRYISEEADSVEDAPISRRAYKKRKQEASQSSFVEEHAGSPPADTPEEASMMNI